MEHEEKIENRRNRKANDWWVRRVKTVGSQYQGGIIVFDTSTWGRREPHTTDNKEQLSRPSRETVQQLARQGVTGEVIRYITEQGIVLEDIARVMGVNAKTVRNYQRNNVHLSPQQSEQLIKFDQLLARGSHVFGSLEAFNRWLHKSAYGLDGEQPIDLLVTSEGINLVSDEVERIANGEFA